MSDKDHNKEIDAHSGVETTGHEWDGLKELNNPAPRWWLIVWLVSIIFAIGYWFVFPAWPTMTGHTKGFLGWTQYTELKAYQAKITAIQAKDVAKLHASNFEQIKADPKLYDFAKAGGEVVFKENCAPCHGAGGAGRKGFPNLNDDDWLFGGTLDNIYNTIKVGARSTDPDTYQTQMPAFGKDSILNATEINDVADYVIGLKQGVPSAPTPAWLNGQALFATNCVSCHAEGGVGNQVMGAPALNDAVWLYGGDKKTVVESITNSRAGVMPTWKPRLSDDDIREAAIYVHSLGGGK